MAKTIEIDEARAGKRADVVVTEALPTLSRAFVHKLFESQDILINDASEKAGYKLRLGDKIKINFELNDLNKIPDIELPILFEDEDVLVIDKPAGVISHARGRYWDEASVASFVRQKTGQEGDRAGIVHRLDRVTSGVMICAKNQKALSWLQKQFSNRKVKKSYVAITQGHLEPTEAVIDMPIRRNPAKPLTFHTHNDGKSATTHYIVTKQLGSYDLVSLRPETGRTHQLRVHLAQVGHPIVGDHLYGGEEADRLYLHASSLEITLPNKTKQTFTSPLPKEFESFEAEHYG